MKIRLFALVLVSLTAFSEDEKPVNYCLDKQVNADWEKMLADTPQDPLIIKLHGLRIGLCRLIEEGKISLEQGTEIWNREHAESLLERSREEMEKKKKITL